MSDTVTSSDIYHNTYEVTVDQLSWRPAAYGIVIQDDRILLTKQHGQYHLPGGGLNLGEPPEDGVVREIHEETGLTVANPHPIDILSGFFTWVPDNETNPVHVQSILLYYSCDLVSGDLSTDGFDEDEKKYGELAEWIPLDRLDDIHAGSTVDWRGVVKRYQAKTIR